jgi:hypothetical protein
MGKQSENALLFDYRHMHVEFKDSGGRANVEAALTMSGPITGFAFRV